jgi:beta-galactosidase
MYCGADYNREQWPEAVEVDVARMQEAGVTMVSLGVFTWSAIQPEEGFFDFEWLDRVMNLLHGGGIAVDLATATASLRPGSPDSSVRRKRSRVPARQPAALRALPSVYLRLAGELVRRIAERYPDHPAVVLGHVNNGYGCHLNLDYSNKARDAFRIWLQSRYGSIDALDEARGSNFWSQRYAAYRRAHCGRRGLRNNDRLRSHCRGVPCGAAAGPGSGSPGRPDQHRLLRHQPGPPLHRSGRQ